MPFIFDITPGGIPAEIDRVFDELSRDVIRFALGFYQALTSEMPVDTGHARVNWLIDFGSYVGRVIGTRPTSGSTPIPARSGQELATWTVTQGDIYVHNSVEYIEYIEGGELTNHPQGVIQPALAAAEARFG